MSKYVPNYGDLDHFSYQRVVRTKSRTYQMACCQGYLGTHEFFLGHSLRGWSILSFTMLTAGSFRYSWELGLVLLLFVAAINYGNVQAIARSDPQDEAYGQECGSTFHSLTALTTRNIFWGINYWKGQEPTDLLPDDMPDPDDPRAGVL